MEQKSRLTAIDPLLIRYLLIEFVDCSTLVSVSQTCKLLYEIVCGQNGVCDELLFRISPLLSGKRASNLILPSPTDFSSKLQAINFYEDIQQAKRKFMVSCGEDHTVIALNKKSIYTFGSGAHGKLGIGGTTDSEEAKLVTVRDEDLLNGRTGVKSVVGGNNHTLVLLENGKLYGFGDNRFGQLGPHLPRDSVLFPSDILFPNVKVAMISCAKDYSAIVLNDTQGTVIILGSGLDCDTMPYGQTQFNCLVRGDITANDKIVQCSAGYHHLLLVNTNGKAYSCGSNSFGQLGIDRDEPHVREPVEIAFNYFVNPIAQVASGENHSMLLTRDGNLFTWGDGRKGQLGNGIFRRSVPLPQEIKLPNSCFPIIITCGNNHSVILDLDGNVLTCGNNVMGQTGSGIPFFSVSRPMKVSSGVFSDPKVTYRKLVHIAAGNNHTAVFGKQSRLYMFGQTERCGGGGFIKSVTHKSPPVEVDLQGGISTYSKTEGIYYTERYQRR